MSDFDKHLQDPARDEDFAREEAWFEYNRVEISMGTLLLFLWWFIDDLVAWCGLVALVLYALGRRVPQINPTLRWFWRTCLMPLAQTDDWIMARWRDLKRWGAAKRMQWAEDWQFLRGWMREAVKREKTPQVAAAMAHQHHALVGRMMSPLNVLGTWLPALAFGIGILLAGAIQEWRIGRVKGEARQVRNERNEAIASANSWRENALAEGKARAELKAQRDADIAQANAANLKTAELLAAERAQRRLLSRRERTLTNDAAKAVAGGPPPDWERRVSERFGDDPGAGAASGGGSATPPGGDPAGGVPDAS